MEEQEKRLKALEGITYGEWGRLKLIIDEEFSRIREKSTFIITEDTLEHLNILNELSYHLSAE